MGGGNGAMRSIANSKYANVFQKDVMCEGSKDTSDSFIVLGFNNV